MMTEQEVKQNLGKGKDLRGESFGLLTPLYPLKERIQRKVVWHCICKCGKECDVLGTNLIHKRTKSCGCLVVAKNQKIRHSFSPQIGEIINGTEILEVEYRKENFRDENECWVLGRCPFCQKEYWVRAAPLKAGQKSCGCVKKSAGESKIARILTENDIKFSQEKTFQDCYYSSRNVKCRFDFYINDCYLVEFDGIQHFLNTEKKFFNREIGTIIKERDEYKNKWCLEHEIPLIRIPYYHYNDLKIEDLMLETTKWRVV